MSKTKQLFLEMQEHQQDTMDDDEYQHWEYTNQLTELFKSFSAASKYAQELEQSNEIRHL